MNPKLNINSSTSNFTVNNLLIQKPKSFKILYLQIPITYYNVDSSQYVVLNGTTYNSSNGLTSGYYNSTQLASLLSTLNVNFTFSYSSTTGKFTIATSAIHTVNISQWSNNMLTMVGYPVNNIYYTNTNLSGSTSYVSTYVSNMIPNSVLRIASSALSSIVQNNQIWSDNSATLIETFVESPYQSIQTQEIENPTIYTLSSNKDIQKIDIQINDFNNSNINLNGVNCCIKLEFDCE